MTTLAICKEIEGRRVPLVSSVSQFLKPERSRQQEVSLNLFYNFLDGSLTGHKSQMANSRHSRHTQTQAQLQLCTHIYTHTHTEKASCGCANQKCRKDESIKNIYMRVHFCISLRDSRSSCFACCFCFCRHCFILTVHTETRTHREFYVGLHSAVAAADAKICRKLNKQIFQYCITNTHSTLPL